MIPISEKKSYLFLSLFLCFWKNFKKENFILCPLKYTGSNECSYPCLPFAVVPGAAAGDFFIDPLQRVDPESYAWIYRVIIIYTRRVSRLRCGHVPSALLFFLNVLSCLVGACWERTGCVRQAGLAAWRCGAWRGGAGRGGTERGPVPEELQRVLPLSPRCHAHGKGKGTPAHLQTACAP